MRGEEDVRLSPERYRAAAAGLLKLPFYVVALSSSLVAFGFWKTVLLAALFAVCGGRRAVSALALRLVSKLPLGRRSEKVEPRPNPRRSRAAQEVLVIDLDPSEFSRTKV